MANMLVIALMVMGLALVNPFISALDTKKAPAAQTSSDDNSDDEGEQETEEGESSDNEAGE
jgi:hypothetical protein